MKISECDAAAAYEDVVARDGETCYGFKVHGSKTSVDDTKYMIAPGENYEQFYYDVPWPTGVQGTRFGANFDNEAVLHHWLLFTTGTNPAHGYHETVIGTLLGDTNAQLLGGWAVGGCNVEFPPHMGLELPPAGTKLNVQWHFYNNTPAPVGDGVLGRGVHRARGHAPEHGLAHLARHRELLRSVRHAAGPARFRGHLPERLERRHHDLGLLAAHARARPPHEVGRDDRCGRDDRRRSSTSRSTSTTRSTTKIARSSCSSRATRSRRPAPSRTTPAATWPSVPRRSRRCATSSRSRIRRARSTTATASLIGATNICW